jgi:hypothetical protein
MGGKYAQPGCTTTTRRYEKGNKVDSTLHGSQLHLKMDVFHDQGNGWE